MTAPEFEVIAELLAEGYEPSEITVLQVVERAMRQLIEFEVKFELSANNIKEPKDGHADPRWYTAMGIKTGFNEALRGVLEPLLVPISEEQAGT